MTQAEFRNWLGDDISWKSLYARQNELYSSREEAIVGALKWCGALDLNKLVELLRSNNS